MSLSSNNTVQRKISIIKNLLVGLFLLFVALSFFINTNTRIVPLKHDFDFESKTKFVEFDLISEYTFPNYLIAANGEVRLEQVYLQPIPNPLSALPEELFDSNFTNLSTEEISESGEAYIKKLTAIAGSSIRFERTDIGDTRISICGEVNGILQLNGNLRLFPRGGGEDQPFKLNLQNVEGIEFKQQHKTAGQCKSNEWVIVETNHEESRSLDLGTFRFSNIRFDQYRHDSNRNKSQIRNGKIRATTLSDSPLLSAGDDLTLNGLTGGFVRSLKFDADTSLLNLLIAGKVKDITLNLHSMNQQTGSNNSLAPSLLSYMLKNWPLFSILLGVAISILFQSRPITETGR